MWGQLQGLGFGICWWFLGVLFPVSVLVLVEFVVVCVLRAVVVWSVWRFVASSCWGHMFVACFRSWTDRLALGFRGGSHLRTWLWCLSRRDPVRDAKVPPCVGGGVFVGSAPAQ